MDLSRFFLMYAGWCFWLFFSPTAMMLGLGCLLSVQKSSFSCAPRRFQVSGLSPFSQTPVMVVISFCYDYLKDGSEVVNKGKIPFPSTTYNVDRKGS